MSRKYAFAWDLIGDLDAGRPNLGPSIRLEVYRLMLYSLRDVLEQQAGAEEADRIIRQAGRQAGAAFYRQFFAHVTDFGVFVRDLQYRLRTMGVGVLRVEQADLDAGRLVLTVSEDVDCSGLPELDDQVCTYDEGFIAGLLESFTHKEFRVTEIDCWCTGDRTCRFTAEVVESPQQAG